MEDGCKCGMGKTGYETVRDAASVALADACEGSCVVTLREALATAKATGCSATGNYAAQRVLERLEATEALKTAINNYEHAAAALSQTIARAEAAGVNLAILDRAEACVRECVVRGPYMQ